MTDVTGGLVMVGLRGGDNKSSLTSATIAESPLLAPFAKVLGRTFLAWAGANADGLSHFRTLGNNLFGLEDTFGGGDRSSEFPRVVVGRGSLGPVAPPPDGQAPANKKPCRRQGD